LIFPYSAFALVIYALNTLEVSPSVGTSKSLYLELRSYMLKMLMGGSMKPICALLRVGRSMVVVNPISLPFGIAGSI
jgi:hypothetical protein